MERERWREKERKRERDGQKENKRERKETGESQQHPMTHRHNQQHADPTSSLSLRTVCTAEQTHPISGGNDLSSTVNIPPEVNSKFNTSALKAKHQAA